MLNVKAFVRKVHLSIVIVISFHDKVIIYFHLISNRGSFEVTIKFSTFGPMQPTFKSISSSLSSPKRNPDYAINTSHECDGVIWYNLF